MNKDNDLFVPTLEEQITCLRREIGMRNKVYPGWVAKGKMKPEKASREIECMEAALGTLLRLQATGAVDLYHE